MGEVSSIFYCFSGERLTYSAKSCIITLYAYAYSSTIFKKAAAMESTRHPSKKCTRADVFVVAGLLAAALFSFLLTLFPGDGAVCVISYADGRDTYPLTADRTVLVESMEHTLSVVIENGAVSVVFSDCPDGVCVDSGAISRTGQAIVCVPAEVIVRIEGGADTDADTIAGGAG